MADTGTSQIYLALNPSVEGDPRVASLSSRLYKVFIQMRLMALNSDEPGVLDIPWTALCECLGIRSPALQERYVQELETRRLIGIRKDDEAIVIARWTMPQLDRQGFKKTDMPRRRYPSDFRRRSASSPDETEPTPPVPLESAPQTPENTFSPAMQTFFEGTPSTAPSEGAESLAESPPNSANAPQASQRNPNKEKERKGIQSSSSTTPQDSTNTEEAREEEEKERMPFSPSLNRTPQECEEQDLYDALLAQGVTIPNARKIVAECAPGVIREQLRLLPLRNARDRPAVLYESCLHPNNWPPPQPQKATGGGTIEDAMAVELAAMQRLQGRK